MILVTGASGIVGSHLLADLIENNRDVRVLLRPNASDAPIKQLLSFRGLEERFHRVDGDVTDPLSIDQAMEGCTQVYHAAAKVSFSSGHRLEMFRVNEGGTEHIVNACIRHKARLCYISSTATMGDQLIDGKITESSRWTTDSGKSDYALSKKYAELAVFRGAEEGLEACMVNPGVIIGPGNWGNSSTSIYMTGRKGMRFFPPGGNGFVDARDVARIAIELMDKKAPLERMLLIGENLPFKTLFQLLAKAHDQSEPSIAVSKGPIGVLASVLRGMEFLGAGLPRLNSESLRASMKMKIYGQELASEKGYHFYPIKEAVDYTKNVYLDSLGR